MANGNLLPQVETILIVMLENRSFDHMLGHLSRPPISSAVDGLHDPLDDGEYDNTFGSQAYAPFPMRDGKLPSDLPHERDYVTEQLARRGTTDRFAMDGFVRAYYRFTPVNRTDRPEAMGFFPRDQVPVTSFLAQRFCVCDNWFAPVPTSTLPNRLMLLAGTTTVDATGSVLPPMAGTFLLDWLDRHGVSWRVYHAGSLSFLLLLGKIGVALGSNSRAFDQFAADFANESDGTFPKVVLIEPSYGDAPRFGPPPNDNHAPDAVAPGEAFLHDIYSAVIANPARWAKTVLVVTYDEHGGFFDHVPPLGVRQPPPEGAQFTEPFTTTGPRVPGVVISPFVPVETPCHAPFDHTSILQLLAERFGAGPTDYSPEVTARLDQGIGSLSAVLSGPADATAPKPPDPPPTPAQPAGPYDRPGVYSQPVPAGPATGLKQAFVAAAVRLADQPGVRGDPRFRGIVEWRRTLEA
jgi:phospholipase C